MLLSIGMMVKNEEKHLEDCLQSLEPIREELNTELIIVDTGSEDSTVEIAKKFTDKVYFHEWNEHFSEMRNIVISYSNGDWYFSLDGDEILSNPETITDFFKSDKYKKYKTGFVTQKNYTDIKEEKFTKILVPRLFKNDDDFHFEGAVHNQPQYKKPIYELNTILNHYGYISSDEELMEKKFQRTATILKRELKKDPENVYYWYQLSRSYAMHGDDKEALEPILKAYNIIKENNYDLKKYMNIYTQLAKIYMRNNKYGQVEKICLEALNMKKGYVDLNFYLAGARFKLNKKEESLIAFKNYIQLVENYDQAISKKDITLDDETLSNIEIAYKYVLILANTLNKEQQYAIEKAFLIQKKKKLNEILKPFIEICLNTKNYISLRKFFEEKVNNRPHLEKKYLQILENKRLRTSDEVREKLSKVFSNLNAENDYSSLNEIRLNLFEENEVNLLNTSFKNIDFNKKPNYFGEMIYYLLINNTFTSKEKFEILTSVKEKNINNFIEFLNKKYDNLKEVLLNFVNSNIEMKDISKIRINKTFCRYLLALDNSDEKYKFIFEKYLTYGTKYISKLYNKDILEKEKINELKNEEETFLLYMYLAQKVKDNDKKTYIQYLRRALDVYPPMKKGVEILLEEFKQGEIKNNNGLNNYKERLQKNIKQLINKEQLNDAQDIIQEYEKNIGKDSELYSMKSIILIMKERFDKGKNTLRKALEKYPNNFDLNYNLAYVYEKKGEMEKAYNIYNEIKDEVPDDKAKNEIQGKLNKLSNKLNNKKNIMNKNKEDNHLKSTSNNTKMSSETLGLFKKNEHQKIVNKIQELNKKREYRNIVNICKYWLDQINMKTAIIHYFLGVAHNGLEKYNKAIKHHKKALELDKTLADIKNRESEYQNEYNEHKTRCLGCNSNDYGIINVTNQSRGKDNKEIINPLRIWVKCNNCGLIYSNPIPAEKSLNKYYSLLGEENKIDNRFEFLISMSNERLEKIEKYSSLQSNNLLDIGTGKGLFVGVAQDRGWNASGLELSQKNCDYAKNNFDLDLINKDFYDFSPNKKYDIITLFEVIEHLREPKKALKRIYSMTREDGIVVIATPIRNSLYGKRMKEKNVFWTTVEHLSFFDKEVMINYLSEVGFTILETNLSQEGMGRMEFYCKK